MFREIENNVLIRKDKNIIFLRNMYYDFDLVTHFCADRMWKTTPENEFDRIVLNFTSMEELEVLHYKEDYKQCKKDFEYLKSILKEE